MSQDLPITPSSRGPQSFTLIAGQTVVSVTGFPLLEAADALVEYSTDDGLTWDDLTLNTDYTVSGLASVSGFTVTLLEGAAAGDKVRVKGLAPIKNTTDFSPANTLKSAGLNEKIDRLTVHLQEFWRELSRYVDTLDTVADAAGAAAASAVAAAAQAAIATNAKELALAAVDWVNFRLLLPDGFDPAEDDVAPHLEAAGAFSVANNISIRVDSTEYQIKTVAEIDDAGARFIWDNARFVVHDVAGTYKTLHTGFGARIGLLLNGTDQQHIGFIRLLGNGTLDAATSAGTRLIGLCTYGAHRLKFHAVLFAINFTYGRVDLWGDDCVIGFTQLQDIVGRAAFGSSDVDQGGSGGDGHVLIGMKRAHAGALFGNNVYKAGRYWSGGALNSGGSAVNNELAEGGPVWVYATSGSIESSGQVLRSADACTIGKTFARGSNIAFYIVRYSGENAGFKCDGNTIDVIVGKDLTSANSAGLQVLGASDALIGSNSVAGVVVRTAINYGLSIQSHHALTRIGFVDIDGADKGFQIVGGRVEIGEIVERNLVTATDAAANYYGENAKGNIGALRVLTGLGQANKDIVRNISSNPASGLRFREIEYQFNGVGNAPLYFLRDNESNPRQVRVDHCIGVGSASNQLLYGTKALWAHHGSLYETVTLVETASVANTEMAEQSWEIAGLEAGNPVQLHLIGAWPEGWTLNAHCPSDAAGVGTVKVLFHNFSGGAAVFPERQATMVYSFLHDQ